jgi:hypothetical protein
MGYSSENFPSANYPSMIGRPMIRADETIDNVQLKVIPFLMQVNITSKL